MYTHLEGNEMGVPSEFGLMRTIINLKLETSSHNGDPRL
jgi:hypothetical protein